MGKITKNDPPKGNEGVCYSVTAIGPCQYFWQGGCSFRTLFLFLLLFYFGGFPDSQTAPPAPNELSDLTVPSSIVPRDQTRRKEPGALAAILVNGLAAVLLIWANFVEY